MRIALLLFAVAGLAIGCEQKVTIGPKKPPASKKTVPTLSVSSLGTPSAFLVPPPQPSGAADKLPFDLPFGKGYAIDGSWDGPNQVSGTTKFERRGEFIVYKVDGVDVDPQELAAILEKWLRAAPLSLVGITSDPVIAGKLRRATDYLTDKTVGNIAIVIEPDAPSKKVSFRITILEGSR